MQTRAPFLIATCLLVLGAGVWLIHANKDQSAVEIAAEPESANSGAEADRFSSLALTPEAQTYSQRRQFESQIKQFIRSAKETAMADRLAQAARLQSQLQQYEDAKQLSAAEAYTLKTAMIKAINDDELMQAEALAELAEHYRQHAEHREVQWLAQQQNDPQFQQYKTREVAVVNEVMAMRDIPHGLSREDYLRQRLQEEREKSYR
jgi:hypothetical protein